MRGLTRCALGSPTRRHHAETSPEGHAMPAPQPKRLQRKRTRGWKAPRDAIYVGRPTKWGNPFFAIAEGMSKASLPALREKAAREYERALRGGKLPVSVEDARHELRGADLM